MQMNKKAKKKTGTRSRVAKQNGLMGIMMFLVFGAVILGVAGLTQSFTADVIDDVRADQTVDDADYNISTSALDGIDNMADRNTTVGSIVGIVVVIGLLLGIVAIVRGGRL